MKKFKRVLISTLLVLSVLGCKVNVDQPAAPESTTTEKTTDEKTTAEKTDEGSKGTEKTEGTDPSDVTDTTGTEGTDPADTTSTAGTGGTDPTDTTGTTVPEGTDPSDSVVTPDPAPAATTEDCNITTTDLAGWKGKLIIEASAFTNMVSGDYITITTESNNSGDANPQLKLCLHDAENDSDATKIGSGSSLTDASYLDQWLCYTLNSANQNTKFYPTDSEIAQLKSKGLMIYGQGVKITSVTIRVNANLDAAVPDSGSSDDGNTTEGNTEKEDSGFKEEETPLDTGADSETARLVHDCKIADTDLGDAWAWDGKLEISASHFADMESGDYIIITTEKSETAKDGTFPQLKLGSNVNWNLQVIGTADSCTNTKEYNTQYQTYTLKAYSQTTRFTPTDAEIEKLSKNGFVVQGQGVTITKVTVHLKDYSAGNPNRVGDSIGTVTSTLSDALATNNTKRLYNYIKANYGNKVITGQMENAWDNSFKQLDKVYADTGKYPALMGFDFIDYNIDWAIESEFNVQTERAINFWNGKDYRGKKISDSTGIVTFCWHWKDPMKETTNESYKPEEINFRIPYDLSSDTWKTTTDEYKAMIRDLNYVAVELLRLQEAGVPVIWRPLHEGAGNVGVYNGGTAWFWWGAGTCKADATNEDNCAEAYIALWKFMYNYFTNTKGIHNLIWLWNGQNEKFYPGDSYVDMLGDDIYRQKNYDAHKSDFDRFQAVNPNLPLALSECGTVPTLENMKSQNAMWSFFMVWNDASNTAGGSDNFWNSENYNPASHKQALYNSTLAITLDDVGDLTKY